VRVERKIANAISGLGTRIALPGYDQLIINSTSHVGPATVALPERLRLRDQAGLLPDLVIMILEKGASPASIGNPKDR